MSVRLDIPPCPMGAVARLEAELGCAPAVAQVLVRRGLADPAAAAAFLAGADRHPASALGGMDAAVRVVLGHVAAGSRITIHGDYDVDGVCSTAILVEALRALGADVDWFLPSRREDGYGLAAATVARLAARGTQLLVTVDCAITAVDEVAAARAAGMDVVVTDHHAPRADGVLPDAPIVHPRLGGYPCPDLCAAGVAHKLAGALREAAGADAPAADAAELDLVALATVADCVPLLGENRRLVREGLGVLATTRRAGLRALMRASRVDPGCVDATAIGFRLAPRLNAAGRIERADAALELLLTSDEERAAAVADELDRLNSDRRLTEQRILFAAEAQVAELGPQPAYVLAGDDWHPGVIGIVASRIAERHHRPCVLVAFDGARGTGSGRSIPAFDLLGGLQASAEHLERHGGHRAAAGCTVTREALGSFRAAFVAHAAAVLGPEDLVPRERVDAVVAGDELGTQLAEELGALAPFGMGNPSPSLLVPAARLADPRPMGEGRHLRFTVRSGPARASAVAFGMSSLPEGSDIAVDATFGLELNEWQGAIEPRLVLRRACPPDPGPITVVGEPDDWAQAVRAELDALVAPYGEPSGPAGPAGPGGHGGPAAGAGPRAGSEPWAGAASAAAPDRGSTRTVRDRRGGGVAGTIAALVATGEPVLVVCSDARRRAGHLRGRLGGVALCSWWALERDPGLTARAVHVVALDPPPHPALRELLEAGPPGTMAHLAWGAEELEFAEHVHVEQHGLRDGLAAAYRAFRSAPADPAGALPRAPVAAGRILRVLSELDLVTVDPASLSVAVAPSPQRKRLESSPTFAACEARLEEGRRWLTSGRLQAA